MKRFALLLLAAAVLASALFTLTSCYSSTPNRSAGPAGADPTDTAPPDAAPAGGGKLICGITEYEPMNYRDASGNWTGFDTEFALLVGQKLGMEVEFQMIEWANKFAELNSGAISCIWNGFTANADENGVPRSTLCDMSYSYMLNQQCVVVKADRAGEFTSVGSLAGKEVAVESGSAGESAAQELIGGSGRTVGASAQINTFLEVKSGAVDCAVVDILLAQKIAGSGDYADLTIANIVLDAEVYAIGFKTGDPLRDAVNQAMKELNDAGTLSALAEKYGLENSYVLDTSFGASVPVVGGKLICGITEYEPMNYRDASGNWTGFDTEFALLVGQKLGMEVEFQMIEWANKFAELNSGAISCIWNGFTANAEENGVPRSTLCDMSYSYMLNQQCVVVKADRAGEFTSVGSLAGKEVAVESGSAGESAAQELIGGSGRTIGASAQINTFLEVKSGAVDCAVVDVLLAQKIAGSGDYADLMIANIELDAEVYAIGFKTGDPLRDAVNQAMKELNDAGTLSALAEKYGLENNFVVDTSFGR